MNHPLLAKIFMGTTGALMALFVWGSVLFPNIPIAWKGGNRAPLSMPSRIAMAIGITCWCLILTGFLPMLWVALFGGCIVFAWFQSSRDRTANDAARQLLASKQPKMTFSQVWPALCLFDGFFLVLSLYAVLRDLRTPPHTDEQRILQMMGIGYLFASSLGAIFLYVKRPRKHA